MACTCRWRAVHRCYVICRRPPARGCRPWCSRSLYVSVVCRNGAARVGGFSLHAGIELAADQREPLERLCRYVSRPPVAEQRLALMPLGQVRYTLTTPWRDGTTQIVHEPLDPTGSRSRARPNRSDAPRC